MGLASKYWLLVKIDNTGKRKIQEIKPAKNFLSHLIPDLTEETEVADTQLQQQLWQITQQPRKRKLLPLSHSHSEQDLCQRCLLCFISWQIERVCHQLAQGFGQFHGFQARDLLPYVLDDDGKIPPSSQYQSVAQEILANFEPQKSSLATWTTVRVKHHPELNRFLLEKGVYLVSDWAILNDTKPRKLGKILRDFHTATNNEIEQGKELLTVYHQVYRAQRLRQRKGKRVGRCQPPTKEQLEEIVQQLSFSTNPKSVLNLLKKLALQVREYRIKARGGSLRTESLDAMEREPIPAPTAEEDEEQQQFLQNYRQQFLSCLDAAVAQVTDAQVNRLERKNPEKAESFLLALHHFHCLGQSMAEIAAAVGLKAQYQVTRLLKLKPFRADIRQQLMVKLRDRVLSLAQTYTNPERLQKLEQQIDLLLEEQITKLIAEAESEAHIPKNRPTNSLFANRLCNYLAQLESK